MMSACVGSGAAITKKSSRAVGATSAAVSLLDAQAVVPGQPLTWFQSPEPAVCAARVRQVWGPFFSPLNAGGARSGMPCVSRRAYARGAWAKLQNTNLGLALDLAFADERRLRFVRLREPDVACRGRLA
jgi:hypothetical protein